MQKIITVIMTLAVSTLILSNVNTNEVKEEVTEEVVSEVVEETPVYTAPRVEYTEPTTEAVTEEVIEETTTEMTQDMITEGISDNMTYLGNFRCTAYCGCSSCCGSWGNVTSTGAVPTEGRTIAVDPSVIPYGTQVIINGHTYIAEDCGGAIRGNSLDIYFNDHQAALNFGVQYLDVYRK